MIEPHLMPIPASPQSPVRLTLDSAALVHNYRALAKLSGGAATGAAVKADGYGLGARAVVTQLRDAGCRDYFVAHWSEAAAIADLIPAAQISVLNGAGDADMAAALSLGAVPMLNNPQQIQRWKQGGGGRCHVMIDSGINRLGIGPEQIADGLFDGLDIDICASHLASADEDTGQNAMQLACFLAAAAHVPAKRHSFANSAGIMLGADYHFDLTRPGIALYGGIPRAEMADMIRQVAYPQAQVIQIRMMPAGSFIGYNATYQCASEKRVATISLGYADGFRRAFSNAGAASFGGIALPIIGRVSMDLVVLDADQADGLTEGDWVTANYALSAASEISGISQYELLTGLGHRFDRIWG